MTEQTLTVTHAEQTGKEVLIVKSVEPEFRSFRIDGVPQLILCGLTQ